MSVLSHAYPVHNLKDGPKHCTKIKGLFILYNKATFMQFVLKVLNLQWPTTMLILNSKVVYGYLFTTPTQNYAHTNREAKPIVRGQTLNILCIQFVKYSILLLSCMLNIKSS